MAMSDPAETSAFRHPGRHRVAVLMRQESLPIELGIVHQLFGQARSAEDDVPLYEVVTCALRPGEISTDGDFRLLVGHGPAALAQADTVIVLSSYSDYRQAEAALEPPLAEAFALIRPGTRIASICTGAFVLAAAGLLDGRRATTHWTIARALAERFPRVEVDPDVLFVDDGDVLTSAGAATGFDLCIHMVRSDFGSAVAADVARHVVIPAQRDGGQAQFIVHPEPGDDGGSLERTMRWLRDRIGDPLTISDIAHHAGMSRRTLNRRFREQTGTTPIQWLLRQRVHHAQGLLETTQLSIEEIARHCGFGTAVAMRQHFARHVRTSPLAYRRAFQMP
jgi:transcriptional regulator GlxA family with amidase domain